MDKPPKNLPPEKLLTAQEVAIRLSGVAIDYVCKHFADKAIDLRDLAGETHRPARTIQDRMTFWRWPADVLTALAKAPGLAVA